MKEHRRLGWKLWLLTIMAVLMLSGGISEAVQPQIRQKQAVFPVPGEWTDRQVVRKTQVRGYKVNSRRPRDPLANSLNEKIR